MNVTPFRIPTFTDVSITEISEEELNNLECLSYDDLFRAAEAHIHNPMPLYDDGIVDWQWQTLSI